jgi:carboxyl-terminal processing protease
MILHWFRTSPARAVAGAAIGSLLVAVLGCNGAPTGGAGAPASAVPACAQPSRNRPPRPPTPTTITTLQQAYQCIFDHYFSGSRLDDRTLLVGAFAALTQELQRRHLDQPSASLPALTGDRARDWRAFSGAYQRIAGALPDDAKGPLAGAAMQGMIQSLHDDHAEWLRRDPPPPSILQRYPHGAEYGLGIVTSPEPGPRAQPDAAPPLFVVSVLPGSPAEAAGLRAGDVIQTVDGVPPFVNGQLDPGVMAWLDQVYPQQEKVQVALQRPSTGRVWSVAIAPDFSPPSPLVSGKLVRGDVAYVQLTAFGPNAANTVLQTVSSLAAVHALRGLVLDLRGNAGGDPTEVARLLGAFVHHRVWSYDVDVSGRRTANHTDDSVPLLHLPLVVLTDRSCVSGCDAFSGAVKDLRAGTLVGTRTAGLVAGPANAYRLDDGSTLGLPAKHQVGANGEMIDGIGVPVDDYAPLTAAALSAGDDPGVDMALSMLR